MGIAIQSKDYESAIRNYVSFAKDLGLTVNEDCHKLLLEYCIVTSWRVAIVTSSPEEQQTIE
jgi:hypothetical protein